MSKRRILVVDDEKAITLSLKYFLNVQDYEVVTSSNGKDALGRLKKISFDVALLDIEMKGVKGTKVAQTIKDKYPNTKIIMVTSFASDYKKEIKAIGVDTVFSKPINFGALANKIKQLLSEKEEKLPKVSKRVIPKAKILFIEKLTPACLLRSYFQHKDGEFTLEIAESGEEVSSKVQQFKPDIVVINVNAFGGGTKTPGVLMDPNNPHAPKDIIAYYDVQPEELHRGLGEDLLKKIEDRVDTIIFNHNLVK